MLRITRYHLALLKSVMRLSINVKWMPTLISTIIQVNISVLFKFFLHVHFLSSTQYNWCDTDVSRLLSTEDVPNITVRLVFLARKTEHTSLLLRELHWLKLPERIKFCLCVLTYRCLYGTAPSYLAKTIRPVCSLAMRRHLRSADTSTLLVPTTCCSTLGDRAFPAAAARAWNSLPCHV